MDHLFATYDPTVLHIHGVPEIRVNDLIHLHGMTQIDDMVFMSSRNIRLNDRFAIKFTAVYISYREFVNP